MKKFEVVMDVALCVVAVIVLVLARPGQPAELEQAPAPRVQVITRQGLALAEYRESDRTLTISPHAPGDLLVCFGDDGLHCELVRGWVRR